MSEPRVMNILPDLSMGGGQVVVLRHLRVMAARGLRPLVAYCQPVRDLEQAFADAGVELVDLGYQRLADAARARSRLVRAVRDGGVDVLQTHGTRLDKYFGHAAALASKAIHVTTFHGNPPQAWQPEPGLRAAARRVKNAVIFRGDWLLNRRTLRGVVAVSDAALEAWRPILRASGLEDQIGIEVIYSGIPVEELMPLGPSERETLRAKLLGSKRGPLLLTVARLWPGKDVDQLVDMMPMVLREHPEAILTVAGDGPERPVIERQIARLGVGDHVRLLGQRSDVPALSSASDLFLFPSKNEGFGLVALEALATGLPVVCFELPSLEKLRRDVRALQVVAETTTEALARRVNELLTDSAALAELGAEGRAAVAERWNVERSTDAYLDFYRRLLDSPARPRM